MIVNVGTPLSNDGKLSENLLFCIIFSENNQYSTCIIHIKTSIYHVGRFNQIILILI